MSSRPLSKHDVMQGSGTQGRVVRKLLLVLDGETNGAYGRQSSMPTAGGSSLKLLIEVGGDGEQGCRSCLRFSPASESKRMSPVRVGQSIVLRSTKIEYNIQYSVLGQITTI
jgi:hypothetical protein